MASDDESLSPQSDDPGLDSSASEDELTTALLQPTALAETDNMTTQQLRDVSPMISYIFLC